MLRQGGRLALVGIGAGALLAALAGRVLGSLLYGVQASDPATFSAVAVIVTLVSAMATFVPAYRASAIAPSDALRHQ